MKKNKLFSSELGVVTTADHASGSAGILLAAPTCPASLSRHSALAAAEASEPRRKSDEGRPAAPQPLTTNYQLLTGTLPFDRIRVDSSKFDLIFNPLRP
jgi:hypothetical protein